MKIVINRCHGGFGLSHKAVVRYAKLKGLDLWVKPYDNAKAVPVSEYHDEPANQYNRSYTITNGVGSFNHMFIHDITRNDPALVQAVEELGNAANGGSAELRIVEIPDDVDWVIDDYDGLEWIAERHRTWPGGDWR
jgi:hypothetical protein